MSYYYNTAGQQFEFPERPLEPQDCWQEDPGGAEDEVYDWMEVEISKIWTATRRGK